MIAKKINLKFLQPHIRPAAAAATRTVNTNATKPESPASTLTLTGNQHVDKTLENVKVKLFEVMSIYEEAIGLKEIKEAQQSVLDVSREFFVYIFQKKEILIGLNGLQRPKNSLSMHKNCVASSIQIY